MKHMHRNTLYRVDRLSPVAGWGNVGWHNDIEDALKEAWEQYYLTGEPDPYWTVRIVECGELPTNTVLLLLGPDTGGC